MTDIIKEFDTKHILEQVSIHEIALASAFRMGEYELERIYLYKMKNEMHNKAFGMRDKNITLTQEEANVLNKKLQVIIYRLEDFDYDAAMDYIVDFDSFVIENSYYNTFCW